jgi:hypothetical protein
LTFDAFTSKQHELDSKLVNCLAQSILDEDDVGLEVIVAGRDGSDLSIYRIQEGEQELCCDGFGYVAIGSGAKHFDTTFMLEEYDCFFPFYEALFLTYLAKKRAESSPGVGKKTDLFVINHEGWRSLAKEQEFLEGKFQEFEESRKKKLEETQLEVKHSIRLDEIEFLRRFDEPA